jgi:hypothetical protein
LLFQLKRVNSDGNVTTALISAFNVFAKRPLFSRTGFSTETAIFSNSDGSRGETCSAEDKSNCFILINEVPYSLFQ